MAITEADYLHIHSGESTYLLLRSPTHFHLVRVDANLTESAMERLLRLYPCGAEQLRELGVHFSAFKAENLRGVVTEGYQAGDGLELWIGSDVRQYQLGSDYSDEILTRFFSGYPITRKLPPKWNGLDPGLIHTVTLCANTVSILCAVLFYFLGIPYKLWSALCILCQLCAIALAAVRPDSFTLADIRRGGPHVSRNRRGNLLPALIAPGFALSLRTLTDFTFGDGAFWPLLGISCVVFLILFAPIIRISRNTHSRVIDSLAVVVLVIFLGMGTIGQLNYLLDFHHTDRYVTEAVDKRVSAGVKATSYYCTVVSPEGELLELTLPAETYRNIEVGGDILVISHSGAFSIPFLAVQTQ